jgi:hypothetical protein
MPPTDEDDDLDPELEKHLEDDEEPYFGDAEDTAEPSPEVAAAAAEVRAEVAATSKRGRPRKPKGHVAGEPIAPQPSSKEPVTRNLQEVWNDIVDRVRDRGLGGPDAVTISVIRHTIGPNREARVNLNAIPGQMVGGTSSMTPGEDLEDYVTRAYHVPSGTGPALYRFRFTLRNAPKNDRHLGSAEILLQSAKDIRAQWEAAAQIQRERERERDYQPVGRAPFTGSSFAGLVGAAPRERGYSTTEPSMPTAADRPTTAPTMPMPAQGGDTTMMFLQYLMSQNEQARQEALRLGQRPPELPPEVLKILGGAAPQAASAADLESRIARTVVETLKAMGIAPAPQTVAAAPHVPLTKEVVATVSDPMAAAKSFFSQMREFAKMQDEMREMFAPPEDDEPPKPPVQTAPTVIAPQEDDDPNALRPVNETFARFEDAPIMFGKKAEDETTFQWLVRLGTGNPKIVGKVLEQGAKLLDGGTLQKLIEVLTRGAVPPQGPPARGLPNGAPIGPQPQQAQANGGRAGWTPNVE